MKRFNHINAKSTDEAVAALKKADGTARVLAGGTDLLGQMKDNILPDYPETLVNLKTIPGLDYIREEDDSVKIGALTKIEDIAKSRLVKQKYPALAEAARRTASPHIREQGTIAGNICQSNRCWYYWVQDNRFDCLRKGGKRCYAYGGEGQYHSIFGSTRVQETPCTAGCPAHVDIASYMEKIREGDIETAARILMEANPFPAITGRVCPHTCEAECNRDDYDEAVAVRSVERFIGDYVLENSVKMYQLPEEENGGTIAVIGSGPAGLACAWYTRKSGYQVTVYEAMDEAGGMLRYGIPAYRLPKDIVRKQVQALEAAGVKIVTGKKIDTTALRKLSVESDAVFIASGAWKERMLDIAGEELLISGTGFLRNRSMLPEPKGKKVAVIGGGNVAMDVSRTLLRMGAEPVIVYRRTRNEMPAIEEELEKAEEEGIEIQFLTLPVAARKNGSRIALESVKMKLGEPDSSGRPVPVMMEGSAFSEEYDAVIKATGEVPDYSFLPPEMLDAGGRLLINDDSRIQENIFAGGDCVSGPSSVINSIAAGRKAAESILRFLGKETNTERQESEKDTPSRFDNRFFVVTERNHESESDVVERVKSCEAEDVTTLDADRVTNEASRCFNCGCLAVNSSDLAPVLIALGATIRTTGRDIAADNFFGVRGNSSTVIGDEIVTEIEIPVPKPETRSSFIKFAIRKSIDFPVVNCAASLEFEGKTVKTARICLNAVYNTPVRAFEAEEFLKGTTISENIADTAGRLAVSQVCPLPDNTYKIQIAKTLVKRAILACADK